MSQLFFDGLTDLEELRRQLEQAELTPEEKEEFWRLIDEMIHHRVMGCIFDQLEAGDHEEFIDQFHNQPHDQKLLDYLQTKTREDVREKIKQEIKNLATELIVLLG